MKIKNLNEEFYQVANILTDDINSFCRQLEPKKHKHGQEFIIVTPISPSCFSVEVTNSNESPVVDYFFEIDNETQQAFPRTITHEGRKTKTVFSNSSHFDNQSLQNEIEKDFAELIEKLKDNGLFNSINPNWQSIIYKEKSIDVEGLKYGDHIGFSKYDLRNNIFSLDDINKIDDLTEYEKENLITKNKILPPVSLKEEIEENHVSAGVIYSIKKVRDALPTSPDKTLLKTVNDKHKIYFDALMNFQSLFDDLKQYALEKDNKIDEQELSSFVKDKLGNMRDNLRVKYGKDVFYFLGLKGDYAIARNMWQNSAIGKIKHDNGSLFESKTKSKHTPIRIRLKSTEDGSHKFYISFSKFNHFILPVVDKEFSSYNEAQEYINKNQEYLESKVKEVKKYFDRPKMKSITRVGEDYRNGRDITPNELMETFGFRAIEYGKWNSQPKVKQEYTNYAYDAFADLANILNIPFKSIGLQSNLAIAFGARGAGRAAAHFEPGTNVINMTKMNGAGSLAHEWGHALDNHIGSSGYYTEYRQTDYPPEVKIALQDVLFKGIRRMTKKVDEDLEKIKESSSNNIDRLITDLKNHVHHHTYQKHSSKIDTLKQYIDSVHEKIFNITNDTLMSFDEKERKISDLLQKFNTHTSGFVKALTNFRYYVFHIHRESDRYVDAAKRLESGEEKYEDAITKFVKDASKLDNNKKKYFSKEVELFARAFEAYIQRKIESKGASSPYLVSGAKNSVYTSQHVSVSPYPNEEEMCNIENKFDVFFEKLRNQPEFHMENENEIKPTN